MAESVYQARRREWPGAIQISFGSDLRFFELGGGVGRRFFGTSPVDGRTHTIAWTHTYGEARVFATTLGHDGKTEKMPEYRQLLENAVLWVTGH